MSDATKDRAMLYRKIAAVAGEIESIEKDGKNKDQGYRYATPAGVMLAVKPLMHKYGIAIVPHQVGYEALDSGFKSGGGKPYIMNMVDMHYHVIDGESGEEMVIPWKGQAGTYGDDKGNAKAQTIALRTFLIQLFQIPAEDPDTDPDARNAQPASTQARPSTDRYRADTRTPLKSNGDAPADPTLASDAQIKALFAIWKAKDYDGTVNDWVHEAYHCHVNELTKAQASAAIETLKGEQASA